MWIRGRGVWWACAPAVVLVVAAFLGAGSGGAASLAGCTDSQLIPRVAEVSVSQGAPGYARLARGKETIVRVYLTTPTTCTLSNRQSIAPFSATLNVTNGNTTAPPQLREYAPLSGKLSAATQIYSTADPFFVVPASYLAPDSPNSFTATFALTITYTRNGVATQYTTSPPVTNKTVDQKTNALRVLVVPMGDPTSASVQWSNSMNTPTGPTAEATLQDVLTNAGRAFPVPTGVSPTLTAGPPAPTEGIRYVVSRTLLDAKSLGLFKTSGTTTKFCANGANWSTSQVTSGAYAGHTLKADLLQRLADYNLQNIPPADMVVGVVDGAIAWKSTDGLGCDDGRATTPASKAAGQIAFVRVSTDPAYPTPLQMELMHPFGVSKTGTFHSSSIEADAAAPDHGYNVLQRKVVSVVSGALGVNDHSIMNYNTIAPNPPYTKDNTLLEPTDWADALCDLGGIDSLGGASPFANCTLSSALGTSQGVPATSAPSMFQISGILSGTAVRVTNAKKVVGDVERGIGASDLHLLLCAGECSGATNKKEVALALLPDEGHTNVANGTDTESGHLGFNALVALEDSNWNCAALTLSGVEKFRACATDPAPDVVSTSTVTPGTVLAAFSGPACCNGRGMAFDGTNLHFTVASPDPDDSSSNLKIYKLSTGGAFLGSVVTGVPIGALGYDPGSGKLYGGNYGNGDVYEINPATGSKSTLFNFNGNDGSCGDTLGKQIDGLEFLPTGGGQLALSGDVCDTVYIKTLLGGAVSQFTTDNNSGITTDGAGGLWLARVNTEGAGEDTRLTHVALDGTVQSELLIPDYEIEDLAYDRVTFAPTCVVWTNPATLGTPEVRAIAVPCGTPSSGQSAAVQTANTRFVSLFFTCGNPNDLNDEKFTLANGLRPDAGGDVVATYTNSLFCGEGSPKIIAEASNGWTSTGLGDTDAAAGVGATSQSPTTNVASPLNGGKYRRGEFVHYEGTATDAEQSAITGNNLTWSDDKPSPHGIGSGQSFDLRLAPDAPLGDHHITLTATDAQGHSTSKTVTITVGPALCPSTSKCP
jgi:hypothetical protein